MHVAACIVGFRNASDVARCIAALGQSTHRNLSIVVCENGGPAAVAALKAVLPVTAPDGRAVTLVQAPGNIGYGGGFNLCVATVADVDSWWLINPDTEPAADALALMVARLEVGDCDLVGGAIVFADGRVQSYGGRFRSWLARAESIGHGARHDAETTDARKIEAAINYVSGASMLAGRRFVQTVGPMREDYFLYAEEVEWCLRGIALGMRLGVEIQAEIVHDQGSTTGSGKSVAQRPWLPIYLDERNRLNVVRDTTPARLPVAALASLLLIGLRYVRRGAWAQTAHAVSGWWAGVRNRRGVPARLATPGP